MFIWKDWYYIYKIHVCLLEAQHWFKALGCEGFKPVSKAEIIIMTNK